MKARPRLLVGVIAGCLMAGSLALAWLVFVVTAVADALFFSFVDPVDLRLVGALGVSRLAAYSMAFFVFWIFAAASSAFTCFLQRSAGS